ncbi:MAG: glycosyltransferase [Rhodospirillales bacterium]|nr:glycosyltransferase [Rhodospirillales bacterium]
MSYGSANSDIAFEPLKILIVVEAAGGGSGRHVIELAEGLTAVGCNVHLIYSEVRSDPNFRAGLAKLKKVNTLSVPMRREPHWTDLGCMLRIRQYIRKFGGFDVVHAHSSKAGVLARIAAIGCRTATIYTPHAMRTMDPGLHPALHAFYRLIEVALARSCSDLIIAVSDFERSHIQKQGVPKSKICVIVNGVPQVPPSDRGAIRKAIGLADNEFCVGFIGRLVPQKAPERFVLAVERLSLHEPRVRGVVVGSGPLQQSTHGAARAAGVFEKIVWITDQPGPAVLPAFDVLLMPSLYEGMPYVLLEALAAGVPIVTTDVGGAKEAVDNGVTGFILPENFTDELVERLALLAHDEPLRQQMSAASLRKSSEVSIDHMVMQTLRAYNHAVRKHGPNRPFAIAAEPYKIPLLQTQGPHRGSEGNIIFPD